MDRVPFVLIVTFATFAGALGCAAHAPAVPPKSDAFTLRYLERDPVAFIADDVHPMLGELQGALLELFDDHEDRRLLAIDPRGTARARTHLLVRRLMGWAPKVYVASSKEPSDIDSDEDGTEGGVGAEEAIEVPKLAPISEDGGAEVQSYLEAYKSAQALGVKRAHLVERALRLFETLVAQAREDARDR